MILTTLTIVKAYKVYKVAKVASHLGEQLATGIGPSTGHDILEAVIDEIFDPGNWI